MTAVRRISLIASPSRAIATPCLTTNRSLRVRAPRGPGSQQDRWPDVPQRGYLSAYLARRRPQPCQGPWARGGSGPRSRSVWAVSQGPCDVVVRDRGLAVDEVVVILGIEDGDSMFWPAKPSMSVRDDHQLTVMTSVRPSPRSVVHIWAPRLPGVFSHPLSPVQVMYST